MENMPKDPMMLYSFINMKLRDKYDSLDKLCDDLEINRKDLEEKMEFAGFQYNPAQNRFW